MSTAVFLRKVIATVIALFLFQAVLVQAVFADGQFDTRTGQETNWGNAGYPPNFAALCQGELRPKYQDEFDANLVKAEEALKAGDLDKAKDALSRADSASIRGPNETFYSAALKCQGEAKARRMFIAWRDYHLARKAQGRKDIPFWVIAADGGKNGILNYTEAYDGKKYRSAVMNMQTIIDRKEQERDYGAFLLSEEEAMLRACKDALPDMQAHASSKHTEALVAEERAFNRAPTEQEKALLKSGSTFGAAMGAGMDTDTLLTGQRVGESSNLLQDARDWNFVLFKDSGKSEDNISWQELPSSKRARQRGDALLAKANDTSNTFTARDSYYDMAIDYYSFGHWNSQRDAAVAAEASIQDGVMAERQEAEEKMQQMQADMESRLENAERAMESMQKNEAEKKSFNDEADALEAELGF